MGLKGIKPSTKTSEQISIDTAAKRALKLRNVKGDKSEGDAMILSEQRYCSKKSQNFTDVCMMGAQTCPPA